MVRIEELLAPAEEIAGSSRFVSSHCLDAGERAGGEVCRLPKYRFEGPQGGGDAIRIGVFAGIHGDEPAGPRAAIELLGLLAGEPELGRGYSMSIYPVCNPGGVADGTRCSRSGKDLNREFWVQSGEREVALLEADIWSERFHGLISLHADDTSHGVYGYVRGAVLTRDLLEPALRAASKILPLNLNDMIDGFPARGGIISNCFDGILTSPPELDPVPFEIILETPAGAEMDLQVRAFIEAVRTVLVEYSNLMAFAANL